MKPLSWPRLILWVFAWTLSALFLTAVVYRQDPVVQAAVRSIFVSMASFGSDAKQLKDTIKDDIKKEAHP